ncbi:MAG TPA: glycosyltransferase family 4 protein [Vicinamibacterales bacterium]|nr:glycosyltransferase family 4 protein [Vicinamibacterales bacterium]
MARINVLEFSNQWSMGGTEKTAQIFIKYLDRDRFNVYAAGWRGGPRADAIRDSAAGMFISEDVRAMKEWIRARQIDIVHFHRMGLPDHPLIATFTEAGVPILIEHNIFAHVDDTADRDRIQKHIFVSKAQLEIYRQRAGASFDASKCSCIYNPVEMEAFDAYAFDRDFSRPTFGRYSRNDPTKWHPINVQILPFVKQAIAGARFHVIGLPDSYRDAISAMGCADMVAEFPNTMSDRKLCDFLNGITVFTHGSAIGESFGISIAEAMASGLPVVTHTGGDGAQAELVTDEYNGFVVDPQRVRAYAARVNHLLRTPDLKRQMGERGRQRAREWFNPTAIVHQLEDLFTSCHQQLSAPA